MPRRHRLFVFALAACACASLSIAARGQSGAGPDAQVDRLLARWTSATPGCAVAASENGRPVLSKAYGMADLEHEVKNTPDTIFEAGSVSKQFTAAAILLLAKDGTLSLDDPVRKYIPELPDYGAPLLIRHMLNHTSGLRDWGSVEGIAGWPRTTRAYTHDHVLDIVSRQKSLNFPTGTRWWYSNTGFNLAAIIVSRVTSLPFSVFTHDRIFAPLGMTHTSWRDDFTRIVKNRAMAYDDMPDGFHTNMPFENVHGNGGLLTTVGDLLRWNENFEKPVVGDAEFVALQQTPGTFNDGRQHDYAFGLMALSYKGLREISHSGSTAGYRAFLSRYPDSHLSVAVLCNVSSGAATTYAHAIADLYVRDRGTPTPAPIAAHTLTSAESAAITGLYKDTVTGTVDSITMAPAGPRVGTAALIAQSPLRFLTAAGATWVFDGRGGATEMDKFGRVDAHARVTAAAPTSADLRSLAGTYVSDEAETTFVAGVRGEVLVLERRPATVIRLTPLYKDAFSAGGLGTVVFHRDAGGRVMGFSISQERVWDLRFRKQS